MDVREKLVEWLCEAMIIFDKRKDEKGINPFAVFADHLIANGVTVHDNTETSDELLKQLRNAPITVSHEEPTIEVVQEWISVKDRLPEKDVRVLVWMQDNEEGYTQMDTDRWSCTMEQGYHWIRWGKSVTHWMPLPQPPKGE